MIYLLLAFIGLVAGTLGSLVGFGGGVILVPVLLYAGSWFAFLQSFSPQTAVGTSLVIVIVTALSSVISYAKQRKVDFRSALLFFSASGPGAIIGAAVNGGLDKDSFQLYFGFMMLFLLFLLTLRNRLHTKKKIKWTTTKTYLDENGEEKEYGYHIVIALLISLVVGIISGLFGIGGGSLLVPAMLIFFHFPTRMAAATSMMVIFMSSIMGSITHFTLGNIDWVYAAAIAPGAWIGGTLGAWLSRRMGGKGVELVLRIMLFVIATKMIWEGVWS